MAQKKNVNERFCHSCGQSLNDDNCRKATKSTSGYSHLCVDCEQQLFDRIAQTQGRYMGLFFTCIALDCPCSPIVLDGADIDTCEDLWITYINALAEAKQDRKRNKVLGFADGAVTALQELFGRELNHQDFVAYIAKERKAIANKPKEIGTESQRERWGELPIYKGLAWTNELYDELDRLYSIRESAYKGQDLSGQQEATLIKVAKNDAIYDYLMRNGNPQMATTIQKTTSQLLADENMRPKDKKPTEEMRIDALVTALEDAGLMENGQLLTYDELVVALRDNFIKSPKYEYSLDVADQMMLDIINSMRQNADSPPIQDLPEEFAPVDEYGEFTPEETEQEKENKRFLGITKVNVVKSDKGEKEE